MQRQNLGSPFDFEESRELLHITQYHDDSQPSQFRTRREPMAQPSDSTKDQSSEENNMGPEPTEEIGVPEHTGPAESNDSHGTGIETPVGGPSVLVNRGSNMLQAEENLGRNQRNRKAPRHLEDYLCYAARSKDPPSSNPLQKASSGKPYPVANYITCAKFSTAHRNYLAAITKIVEPRYFHEAVKDIKWREAMAKEIEALELNKTWTIEDLPPNKKPINCKWVYKVKYNSNGTIERYKARLVIRGDEQIEGFDYHETFAPVAKMVSVRCFLAVAIAKGWELHQMDVHNAFLHGDLDEEVYMRLPPGFSPSGANKVCKLRKSLYGLKQAPRQWFAKLSSKLLEYGFVKSYADYSLFTYRKGDIFMALLVYVDDLVLTGNNPVACAEFKSYLNSCFHIKDLGPLKYFLGIEVARSPHGLFLCQRKYALEIIEECGLLGSKPVAFPMEANHRLAVDESPLIKDPTRYRRLVGRLIYLTITRPELCYAVHILSQFMQAPTEAHMEAARRVLRYLKGNPGQGLLLKADADLNVFAFCDSDWGACPLTRRSLTGYFVTIGGSPVSWKTKKQSIVSRSSAEAEYRAMATVTSELIWIKSFLSSLGIFLAKPMKLYCDNQAALHIAKNPVFHERTKHIEIDCHFVRERLLLKDLDTGYVASRNQVADIFTKPLGTQQFQFLRSKLGILNPHAPT